MNTKYMVAVGVIVVVVLGWFALNHSANAPAPQNGESMGESDMKMHDSVAVSPISHATAVLEWPDGAVVYTDPVGDPTLFASQKAPSLIVVTDIHGDHFNIDTLAALAKEGVAFVVPQAVADMLPEDMRAHASVLQNGETGSFAGFSVEAIPMYNLPESADSPHTKGRGNGYVIARGGIRLYVAGDTADTPEMRALKDIDVALVPMNLPYTMSVASAAEGVLAFAPKVVYPYHYREPDGFADVQKFKELVNIGNSAIEVVLLDWYPDKPIVTKNEAATTSATGKSFDIVGTNFSFNQKEIRVKQGETVTINFSSADGFHDWAIDEFNAKTARVQTGGTASVTFVADKTGSFEYYCSVGQHRSRGMVGSLIVE